MLSTSKLVLTITLICAGATATADPDKRPDLRQIMQGLRDDSVLILDGLLINDLDKVTTGADSIADHPEIPPEQVALVATELGPEMAAFKQLDTLVHDLSLLIRSAALDGSRERATSEFQNMVNGCLACHVSYRERISVALGSPPATDRQ